MLRQILFFLFQAAGLFLFSQPVITSFSPTKAPVSSTVTITGTGFNNDPQKNTVWFGSVRANIVSATSTSLVVTVPVAAGSESYIQVAANGLNAFSSIPFQQLAPTGAVTSTISFDSSVIMKIKDINAFRVDRGILMEDVDMDGRPDLVLIDTSRRLLIYRNISTNKTIQFEDKPAIFSLNQNPFAAKVLIPSIAMADMNGDGIKDFVLADSRTWPAMFGIPQTVFVIILNKSNAGTIRLGKELRLFQDYTYYQPTISLKDMNMDGKTDIVATHVGKGSVGAFMVDINVLDSSIVSSKYLNASFVNRGGAYDFTNDNRPDMLGLQQNFGFRAYFIVGRNMSQNGVYSKANDQNFFGIRVSSNYIGVSDLDQDGKLDILIQESTDLNPQVPGMTQSIRPSSFVSFRNISTRDSIMYDTAALGREMFLDSVSRINYFELYDLNRDGLSDLVIIDNTAKRLKIYWNRSTTGNILFSKTPVLVSYREVNGKPQRIIPTDMNGDGFPDIGIMTDQGEFIMLTNTSGAAETNFSSLIPTSVDSSLFVYRSSTENPNGATALTVFPNPVKNLLTVKKPQSSGTYTVNINGINGTVRFVNKPIDNGIQLQINVSTLPSGVYTITLFDKAGSIAGRAKFIK